MVFGPVGQGKSALVNSMISLSKPTYEQVVLAFPASRGATMATKFVQRSGGFGFLDTQGAVEANYLSSEFSLLLKGALPYGYDVLQKENDIQNVIKAHMPTAEDRKIHCCVFVANQSIRYLQPDDPLVVKTKKFMKEARDAGYIPILAVTKMDEVKDDEVKGVQEEMSELLEVNPSEMFLISNDVSEGKKPPFEHEKVAQFRG